MTTPVPAVKNEKKALKKAKSRENKLPMMNWIRFWQNYRYSTALCSLFPKLDLQSISRYSASQKISQASSSSHSLADLLSVSLRHLGEAEMREFFGSKVVQATRSGESSNRKKVPAVRSNLTRPQRSWWAARVLKASLSDLSFGRRSRRKAGTTCLETNSREVVDSGI